MWIGGKDEEVHRHAQQKVTGNVADNIGSYGIYWTCFGRPAQSPGTASAIHSGRASKSSSAAGCESTCPATAASRTQARNAARGTARYPAGCAVQGPIG